ncbi:conserved hypothetical ABC transporter protein [Vibrio sinaloensis DSM 21326]|uniref:Conserved hypothetical ABC transporter protein n=1 Tax=Vibrio sinaloensis DSM 21326 TaxID=945550 RepID=E8M3T8_PHOS4|nr:ABC transporter substrate-binding protein [Vibrio sinaloensis]EGA71281.1 conserved hypothetical ABC transporter protein [Vibrio sinaloensis DSM 21326]
MKWWLVLCLLCGTVQANQQVYMTSLEWPPYSGAKLAENGLSVAIAREAFAVMGYDLVVEFKPWVRSVATATKQERFIGYFPEYYFDSEEFVFSQPIGSGPLGLVQNTRSPIYWSQLSDLKGLRIGVVQGYVNTKEFDQLVERGFLAVEASVSDSRNIHKVAKSRLDVAVIDTNVLDYLISVDPRREVLIQRLEMNQKLLAVKQIYLAFKNTPEGQSWRDIFNKGLKQVDINVVKARLEKSMTFDTVAQPAPQKRSD